jgi:hypothetical protein
MVGHDSLLDELAGMRPPPPALSSDEYQVAPPHEPPDEPVGSLTRGKLVLMFGLCLLLAVNVPYQQIHRRPTNVG